MSSPICLSHTHGEGGCRPLNLRLVHPRQVLFQRLRPQIPFMTLTMCACIDILSPSVPKYLFIHVHVHRYRPLSQDCVSFPSWKKSLRDSCREKEASSGAGGLENTASLPSGLTQVSLRTSRAQGPGSRSHILCPVQNASELAVHLTLLLA